MFFRFLLPAPHIPEIQDPELVRTQYRYWRIRILYSMFIGYAFYYFTRRSLPVAIPSLITDLGFDKEQLGFLGSVIAITYGISKFVSGMIGDRINPRYMMAMGLILTGVFNICFGFSSSLLWFAIFWGLNGWFQGFGWPPCARFLTQWYSHSERGSWWSTWNVSHNVGGFLIPWVAGFFLQVFGWRYAMWVPGICCIFVGFFLINRLRDTPQSLGLPPIEVYRNDQEDKAEAAGSEKNLTAKEIFIRYVLKNPYIWVLAFANFFVHVVRFGISDWTTLFLVESKAYSIFGASGASSMLEIGGFCGSLAAGWSSDYLFGAKRGPVNALFTMGIFLPLALFWFVPPGYPSLDAVLIFALGFTIFGPQMMIGLAGAELSHKQAAATSTGFIGFFAYLGAACAGYPLAKITQNMGWNGFFLCLLVCCLISVLLLLPLWSVTAIHRKTPLKPIGNDPKTVIKN